MESLMDVFGWVKKLLGSKETTNVGGTASSENSGNASVSSSGNSNVQVTQRDNVERPHNDFGLFLGDVAELLRDVYCSHCEVFGKKNHYLPFPYFPEKSDGNRFEIIYVCPDCGYTISIGPGYVNRTREVLRQPDGSPFTSEGSGDFSWSTVYNDLCPPDAPQ